MVKIYHQTIRNMKIPLPPFPLLPHFPPSPPFPVVPGHSPPLLPHFPLVLAHPPLPLQQKFAAIVEQVEHLGQQHKQSKQEAEDLFNALMQKTFRGELT